MECKICGYDKLTSSYAGRIRDGSPGNYKEDVTIYGCLNCRVESLPEELHKGEDYYTSAKYHDDIASKGKPDIGILTKNYQVYEPYAGKTALDVGSGLGWNAKMMRMCTDKVDTYDINPKSEAMYNKLPKDKYDVITAFTVVEHVPNPKEWLLTLKSRLNKGGTIVISTPNLNSYHNRYIDEYASFFYRTQHNWYFTYESLGGLFDACGMATDAIDCGHFYGLNNTFNLMETFEQSLKAGGEECQGKRTHNTGKLDQAWKEHLEEYMLGDIIYSAVYVDGK